MTQCPGDPAIGRRRARRARWRSACAAALVLAACEVQPAPEARPVARDPGQTPSDTGAPVPDAEARRTPLWSRDGVEVQARLDELRAHTPRALGFEPASTSWRQPTEPFPPTLLGTGGRTARRFATPGAAVLATLEALDVAGGLGETTWEVTARVLRESERDATAIIMEWGLQDDAIAGRDWLLTLAQRDGAWRIVDARVRTHCARRVTDDDLCG